LVSRKRGRVGNRRIHPALQMTAVTLVREHYSDFGPTFAAEKLAECHGLHVGRETLRQWMIEAGLWQDRQQRHKAVHQPRYRRDCLGELVQIDGSDHHGFEDRAPRCTLLVWACRKVCQQAENRADWHSFQAGFPSEGPIRSNHFRGHSQSLRQAQFFSVSRSMAILER
jgi:hypothetical protein